MYVNKLRYRLGRALTLVAIAAAMGIVAVLAPMVSAARASGCTPTSGQQNGVDVSSLAGNHINYSQVAAAGVKFVYARVSDGSAVDTAYSTNAANARASGLAFGAYQLFEPAQDPVAQANLFITQANFAANDLIPVVDVEATGGQSAAKIKANLTTWLDHVQAALGVKPVIYTNKAFWDNNAIPAGLAAAGYPLWDASYTSFPTPPSEWSSLTPPWVLWQYSDMGFVPGIPGLVDVDYLNSAFNGGNLCALTLAGQQTATPANTTLPQISGTPSVGQTLSCSQGSWTNFPGSFGYQWLRDDAAIATAATGVDYTVSAADAGHHLSCQVTAGNSAGSVMATSAAVGVPTPSAQITTPTNGATYTQGQVVDAAFSCTDQPQGSQLASCTGPVVSGAPIDTQALGSHTFTVTATDTGGSRSSQTVSYTVVLPAPTLGRVRETAKTWRESNARPHISGNKRTKPPIGTTISFVLNERATVRFSFTQSLAGGKVKGRCVAETKNNRRKPRCRRTIAAGTFTFTGHSGTNQIRFAGRISPTKKLQPRPYTLVITATNTHGRHSAPNRISFTIVK